MNYYDLLIRRSRNQSPQDNEIWYYANEQVTLYSEADVTSHTFSGGKGVITYSSAVTAVPEALRGVTTVTDVQFPSTVTSIATNAFNGCTSLALKKLPDGLTGIGNNAFLSCTNLALTELPSSLKTMGTNVFSGCTSLALTSLPEGLTIIQQGCFDGCSNLALTSLPDRVTYMGGFVFRGCKKIALTYLPEGLTSIAFQTFSGCSSLALTSFPEGLTSIGGSAFSGCSSLALTVLPEGLTTIEGNAFANCTGLTSITFLGTPTTLGAGAFSNCTNLKDIYVPWADGDIAGAPWGATNATVHYTESTGGGVASFPDTFSVTSCSYNGAAVGTYAKTSETTKVNGVDYPVYSRYYDLLGTTFYIFVCDKFNGTSGAYWALNGDSEYSSSMDGNNTLGAVSVGSDGLPTSTTWTAQNNRTSTVSWS